MTERDRVERRAMLRAVELAALGRGTTRPNPVVGAVVLNPAGEIVGEGYHAYAGGPHAEVVALRAAGAAARGGTAVVTLEPCDHTGRTPPCSQALLAAGVTRVVYAVPDPNEAAAGGAATLRAAGVDVVAGLGAVEAEAVNRPWLTAARRGWPYVVHKLAATLDGRVAAADGSSQWITGPEARADAHRLRAGSDAVLVGSGTVLADDPTLTVRDAPLTLGTAPGWPRVSGLDDVVLPQPLRVVADSAARTPLTARLLDVALAPTLIAVAEDVAAPHAVAALRAAGADVLSLPAAAGRHLDLAALLRALYARGVRQVLVEGGPTLAGALVAAGLVDEVVAYLAPALLGAGRAALSEAGIDTIADAWRLEFDDVTRVGRDLRLTATPQTLTPQTLPPETLPPQTLTARHHTHPDQRS
jgi:diaminohydroxyphosphoribosylaminopyrimidine deaminase/5-amino-6-(5-phosphoribosylamino)uracil reductase